MPAAERELLLFCSRCGSTVPDNSRTCHFCGSSIDPTAVAPSSVPPPPPGFVAPTSGKAIASLILGFFFFILPSAILAVIFGHLSLSDIRKSGGRLKGNGIATAGLVLGYLGVAALPIILIVAAIAIPNLLRARMSANETSAISSVRYLNQAEASYAAMNPQMGFACDFQSLIDAGLLDASIVRTPKHGYVLGLQGCGPRVEGGPNAKYQVVARPVVMNQTGRRAFCSDESSVIKFDPHGSTEECLQHGTAF